jgi:hypothetical protein
MCVNFDAMVVRQCLEEDAEEIFDKEKANFCDWYKPSSMAFNPSGKRADETARSAAEALFQGESVDPVNDDSQLSAADELFK